MLFEDQVVVRGAGRKPTMRRFWTLCSLLVGVCATLTAPARTETSEAVKQVMAVEQARAAALDRSDVPALGQILADDLTYVHASGRVDTKLSLLAAIGSGQLHYISWEPANLNVRVSGDSAVINGEYLVRVSDLRVQPDPFNVNVFFLTVYARRDGRWQQIAWESTRDVALSPTK
jgi:hypothetical protein